MGVARNRGSVVTDIFGRRKVAIGVIHCPPLPGTPDYEGRSITAISDLACADAEAYVAGGIDGLIVENHGDIPFVKPVDLGPETAACMAVITDRIRREFGVPLGINVLANAPVHALAVAVAGGARFVRVNQWANAYVANEGLIEGEAGRTLRYRATIGARDIAIFADSHVKHGSHAIVADRSIQELTRDLEFFHADAVIATGQRTGDAANPDEVRTIGDATSLPVLIGSGVTGANVESLLEVAEGVIIGSSLKAGGVWWNPVEQERVVPFMQIVRAVRERFS
jgi:membrane complex biogenesis BtpA family protein